MKIFIAGATGVLGRALIPLLIQKGYFIRAIARTPEKVRDLELAGVETTLGDLLDYETARQLPELLHGCDAAIHIATAIPHDRDAVGAWETTTRLRIDGTRLLLRAALASQVKRYIQQSITMAYVDGGDSWLDEFTPLDTSPERAAICRPIITMEELVREVSPDQLQWCILRGGFFIGPETMQEQQIADLRAERLVVAGDGRNFLSLINVFDMASAVDAALEHAPASSTFNIVDQPIRNSDYLEQLAELVGAPRPHHDPRQPTPPSFRCDNQAAKRAL
ncbi:MAG: NAD(P)-dependent oxidoreductase, partial [Ktedonobacteraceae bacterium]|nr:NAD(P)-dependent oxidoreductase [Ktedonobacteraceae bacterium]